MSDQYILLIFRYINHLKTNVMNKLFFVPSTKINARIADTVISGQHITIEGLTYQMVSKRPQGRRVLRKLQNLDTNTQITIYS